MVVYRNKEDTKKDSWVRYFLGRIRQNKNNLVVVVGKTGSGKTWSAVSVCEKIAEKNGVPFTIENIIFNLGDLMRFINSPKAVKGASIIFDEPQVTISSKEFMSQANKVFNYLLTTFRHKNLNLFFCTPYEDLLDKTSRKLFHTKFETMSINHTAKTCRIKPKIMEYNSQKQKFYEKFLRVCWKPLGKAKYITSKLKFWDVSIPSEDLIKKYEAKKLSFTTRLNQDISAKLEDYEEKQRPRRKKLTEKQEIVLKAKARLGDVKLVAKELGIHSSSVYETLKYAEKKGFYPDNFKLEAIS